MNKGNDKAKIWFQAGGLVLLAALLVIYLVKEETQPLDANLLKLEAAELRSFTAEGKLLAEQALAERLTRPYVQVQTAMLAEKSQSALQALTTAKSEPGVEFQFFQIIKLAQEVNAELKSLASASGNPQAIEQVRSDLENLFPQLMMMEQSLTQAAE